MTQEQSLPPPFDFKQQEQGLTTCSHNFCTAPGTNQNNQTIFVDQNNLVMNTLNSWNIYLQNFHSQIIPRIKKTEENQSLILATIQRERLLEQSISYLKTNCTILSFLLSIMLLSIFITFCLWFFPEKISSFFNEHKILTIIIPSGTLLLMFAKPLYDIHNYNKRLDAIEKILKLNGNT